MHDLQISTESAPLTARNGDAESDHPSNQPLLILSFSKISGEWGRPGSSYQGPKRASSPVRYIELSGNAPLALDGGDHTQPQDVIDAARCVATTPSREIKKFRSDEMAYFLVPDSELIRDQFVDEQRET